MALTKATISTCNRIHALAMALFLFQYLRQQNRYCGDALVNDHICSPDARQLQIPSD
jgi:hypothetical protein